MQPVSCEKLFKISSSLAISNSQFLHQFFLTTSRTEAYRNFLVMSCILPSGDTPKNMSEILSLKGV